jgi:hypothetical protein
MVCSFLDESRMFIALYHSYNLTQYHFIYDYKEDQILGEVVKLDMNEQGDKYIKSNYLCNCFYNPEHKNKDKSFGEMYLFYRQGHSYIINVNNINESIADDITDYELGAMYLIFNTILMVRSETSLNFYKIEVDEITELRGWKLYHSQATMGFINFTPGNVRFQIITTSRVQFWKIDKDTLMPTMENCMYNYMDCTSMMFDKAVKYCVYYKQN